MKYFLESGSKHVTKPGHMVPEAIWRPFSGLVRTRLGSRPSPVGGSRRFWSPSPDGPFFRWNIRINSCTRATTAFLRRFLSDCLKHIDLLEMNRAHKQSPGRLNELQNVSTGSFWVNGASRHSQGNKAAAGDGRADGPPLPGPNVSNRSADEQVSDVSW